MFSKLAKFMKTRQECIDCTNYLKSNNYTTHQLECKNWDLAHVINDVLAHKSAGNFLDMGSSESHILMSMKKIINGKLCGIDLRSPIIKLQGVEYRIGDMCSTNFPNGHFKYITCLSVIEHGVNFQIFVKELHRLLCVGGMAYVTYDYWDPKVPTNMKHLNGKVIAPWYNGNSVDPLFGLEWDILCKQDVLKLSELCKGVGLTHEDIDWTIQDQVINQNYYAPAGFNHGYTFGILKLVKEK